MAWAGLSGWPCGPGRQWLVWDKCWRFPSESGLKGPESEVCFLFLTFLKWNTEHFQLQACPGSCTAALKLPPPVTAADTALPADQARPNGAWSPLYSLSSAALHSWAGKGNTLISIETNVLLEYLSKKNTKHNMKTRKR